MSNLRLPPATRTDGRISVPPRGERPGHKIGRNNRRYWIAKQVVTDPMNFPDTCIALPARDADETPEAWEARIAQLCREYTARLYAWIDARKKGGPLPASQLRYDGTVASACDFFVNHELSPFNVSMKFNSQATCRSSLRLIKAEVGQRLMRNVTVPDCKRWYANWRAPYFEGDREHTKRAHDALTTFRQVVYFMAAMRFRDCKELAEELSKVHFEKAGAREQQITLAQACAFIRTALDLGQRGVIPAERGVTMALGMAAQFDITAVRQRDVIGEWADNRASRTIPSDIARYEGEGETWIGYFTWENIPGWRWRMRTFKSRFRKAFDFNLQNYPLLFSLLEAVPHDQRVGPIIKGNRGMPIRRRSYSDWFREIATAAGIPADVWNMDSRAGGASEAFVAAGGDIRKIQAMFKHASETTSWRYIRGDAVSSVNDELARARNRLRPRDGTA